MYSDSENEIITDMPVYLVIIHNIQSGRKIVNSVY